MSKKDCCETTEQGGSSVKVSVDVTKIVKYVCIAGVLIVGIIFGSKCFSNLLEDEII
ncbi:hypothetical protein [Herbinix luporum]|jgi:hypothetical protein|uniref:Putative membrane protein n=1 Tax=Herbinix luporum TaxID=1679721 RepID=A0A0K8J3U4_9FIRM|nr:hypothetical protein [Herbinix luporum]MDI9488868.1 hypothetical protein [Bacillota bacterium]CUH92140.1 putative membrane protein [Herbinix luporum]HHT57477.1 hypothetical protein [Herbinix luporum]